MRAAHDPSAAGGLWGLDVHSKTPWRHCYGSSSRHRHPQVLLLRHVGATDRRSRIWHDHRGRLRCPRRPASRRATSARGTHRRITRTGPHRRAATPRPSAMDLALELFEPAARPSAPRLDAGYLDLLGDRDPTGAHPGQRLMASRVLPLIYERFWRPLGGRLAHGCARAGDVRRAPPRAGDARAVGRRPGPGRGLRTGQLHPRVRRPCSGRPRRGDRPIQDDARPGGEEVGRPQRGLHSRRRLRAAVSRR